MISSSSGLGRAVALNFAVEDAKLIVCANLSPAPRSAGTSDGAEPARTHLSPVKGRKSSLHQDQHNGCAGGGSGSKRSGEERCAACVSSMVTA